MSTLTTAINREVEQFGQNPEYAYLRDTEYACRCTLGSAQSPALRAVKALWRALNEGRITREEYRLRVAFWVDEL